MVSVVAESIGKSQGNDIRKVVLLMSVDSPSALDKNFFSSSFLDIFHLLKIFLFL